MRSVYTVPLGFGARASITINTDTLETALTGRIARLRKPRPILASAAQMMRLSARAQFAQGGSPAWKPLAASTIAAKSAAGLPARTAKGNVPTRLKQGGSFGPGGIEIATGRRRDAWSTSRSAGGTEKIDEGAGVVEIGSSLFYEKWQQEGTSPYVIAPKSSNAKGLLAFTGAGGKRVFTKRPINHPGLVARPVRLLPETIAEVRTAIEQYIAGP